MRSKNNNRIISIGSIPVPVEVAETEESRAQGLMNRDSLAHDAGMLFIFDNMYERGFWMKNTRIPLSIAFIDDQGQILNIEEMNPYDQSTVRSRGSAQCALEMNQGWFRRKGILPGDTIEGIWGEDGAKKPTLTLDNLRRIIKEEIYR